MKKIGLILIAVAILITSITGVNYAIAPDQQAKIFVDQAFQDQGWQDVCIEDWKSMRFDNLNQAERTTIGEEPLQVYNLDIETFDFNQDLAKQAQIMPMYIFPVLSDNKVVTDIYVWLKNGRWEVLSLGGHLYRSALGAASRNNLDIKDCKIIKYGYQETIIANKNGDEIGVSYPNSNSLMTQNNIKKLKESILQEKQMLDYEPVSNEQVLAGNEGSNDPSRGFQQNASRWKRLVDYIFYKIH